VTDYVWRVTYFHDKPVDVSAGLDFPQDTTDNAKMHAIGEMMITIGSRLLRSTVEDDEDDE